MLQYSSRRSSFWSIGSYVFISVLTFAVWANLSSACLLDAGTSFAGVVFLEEQELQLRFSGIFFAFLIVLIGSLSLFRQLAYISNSPITHFCLDQLFQQLPQRRDLHRCSLNSLDQLYQKTEICKCHNAMEARLICLEKDRRHGLDCWELSNSPGIPISTDQLRELPSSLINADHAKIYLYERLTTILFVEQERFNVASIARGGFWTEW